MLILACSAGLPRKLICSGTRCQAALRPPNGAHPRASRAYPTAARGGAQHRSPHCSRTAPSPTLTRCQRSKGHLLQGRDVLIAEEDYGVIIVSALDSGERLVVDG